MRRLFWICFFLGAYLWIMTSGNDEFLFDRARTAWHMALSWLEGADADFHLPAQGKTKRARRWD
jgi:hypothetical protein